MAPPNTYRKLNRNRADWMMPMAHRPGVRMYFRSTRRATSRQARAALGGAPGRVMAGVVIIVVMVIESSRSPRGRR